MTPTEQADPALIARLRAGFDGSLIEPADPRYDEARMPFYGGIDRRPAAIVRPTDAAGVAAAVSLVRDSGLELAIRGGGHSSAGHGTSDGGVVIDLAELRGVEIDPDGMTARAGTGLTTGELTDAAGAHNLAIGFGDAGSVGIGGITLGGGVGFLSRAHGLTIDNLIGAELVTAEGRVLEVDAERHPDLFWAIRGGGGNFGVATRLDYRLRPLETVVGGMLLLPGTAEVIEGIVAACEAAPPELSVIANVMPAPPLPFLPAELHGRLAVLALVCFAGPAAEAERALAPIRALAPPLADLAQPMPYPSIYQPEEEGFHPTAVVRTMFIDRVDRTAAETMLARLEESDAMMRVVQLRVLGGAIAEVGAEETAYAHRDARIMANVASFYDGPDERPLRQAWVEGLASELDQGDERAYVNFLGDEGPERVRAAYPGATWDRLVEVKRRHDPENLFRSNQNIPPHGAD